MTTLKPTATARERILAIGGPGTGKTSGWLSIAEKCPDANFYVIDSDEAVERMIEGRQLANVTYKSAYTWEDFVEHTKDFQAQMRPDDWLVVDFLSPAWDAVQTWYSEQMFGKDLLAYFIEARKSKAKGNPIDGDKDWPIIKRAYRSWVEMLKRNPGHLYATAPVKAIGERDDPTVKSIFGVHGVRPEGEKTTGHWPHTILLMKKTRMGEWQISTVKDRERREVENLPVKDLVSGYLIPVAGWRPA